MGREGGWQWEQIRRRGGRSGRGESEKDERRVEGEDICTHEGGDGRRRDGKTRIEVSDDGVGDDEVSGRLSRRYN